MMEKSHAWLAYDLVTTMGAANPRAAQLLVKIGRGPKVWLKANDLMNICNLKFTNIAIETIIENFNFPNENLWLESTLPLGHSLVFANPYIKQETPDTLVPFAVFIERKDTVNSYYITLCCRPEHIYFCPLGLLIFLEQGKAHWQLEPSYYFPDDYWDSDLIQDLLPLAESTMRSVATFFLGALVVLGNQYFAGYTDFHATIH